MDESPKLYSSIQDVIDSLAGFFGDFGDDYDVEAIAKEATEWFAEVDENGNEHGNCSGIVFKPYYGEDEDQHWQELLDKYESIPNAIYYNANGTTDLVVLDSGDCVYRVVRELDEDEISEIVAGEHDRYKVDTSGIFYVEIGDGDYFTRITTK